MTELSRRLRYLSAGCLVVLAACSEPTPIWHEDEVPQRLSDWQLFTIRNNQLTPVADTLVFRPASTLYSDYAQKLRSLWIPAGKQAEVVNNELVYPVGTVLSKTFYYPSAGNGQLQASPDQRHQAIDLDGNQVLETRLLVKQASGWQALPYVWNTGQTEAFLRVAGSSAALSVDIAGNSEDFRYFVPNQNQCSGCHQTEYPDGDLHPLGARLTQLAASAGGAAGHTGSQLAALAERGWLTTVPAVSQATDWSDPSQPLDARALAYLNMNCGHCHNPAGPADTSALILNGQHRSPTELGMCKPPVAAGGGAGELRYGIVPGEPEQSIMLYRLRSTVADEMMPELGRALAHREGVRLIRDWIAQLPGGCRSGV